MIAMWILCFHCALIHRHRATFESRPWKKLKRHFFFDSLRCVFRMMVCSACEMNLLKGSDISTMHIFSVYVWCRPQVSITNYSRWIITFNLQFYGTFRMVRRFRAVTLIEIFYLVVPFKHFNYYLFIICYDRALLVIFSWFLFFLHFHSLNNEMPTRSWKTVEYIDNWPSSLFTIHNAFGFWLSMFNSQARLPLTTFKRQSFN